MAGDRVIVSADVSRFARMTRVEYAGRWRDGDVGWLRERVACRIRSEQVPVPGLRQDLPRSCGEGSRDGEGGRQLRLATG